MTSRLHMTVACGLLLALTGGQARAQTEPASPAPAVAAPPSERAAPAGRDAVASPKAAAPGAAGATAVPAAAGTAGAASGTAAAKPAAPPADGNSIRVEKTGGNRLFRITEGMLVEGQRQKPNAFYVLQRASAAYDWESLDENFLQRIIKATEKPPF